MAYIGNTPAEKYISLAVQHFTTSATASYTLSNSVTNENGIALFINNVRQEPGSGYAYTATGTTLTLSAATLSTDTMYCVYLGKAIGTVSPPDGSVSSASIVDGTIVNDDLAGSITSAKIASLDAAKLTGTVADARFPATLPAISGANLTNLPATANEITKQSAAPTVSSPATPTVGDLILATSTGQMYVCSVVSSGANQWLNIGDGSGSIVPTISATGGTIVTYTYDSVDYKVHKFTGPGTFAVSALGCGSGGGTGGNVGSSGGGY